MLDVENDGRTRLNILVVDDDDDSAWVLSTLLTMGGHRAQMAHGAVDALEAVGRDRYDAVLVDLGMRFMQGFEAGALLVHTQPTLILVACSARDDSEIEATLVQHPAVLEAAGDREGRYRRAAQDQGLCRAEGWRARDRGRTQGLRQGSAGTLQVSAVHRIRTGLPEDRHGKDSALPPS